MYFLQGNATLNSSRPGTSRPTRYRYDPTDPTPAVGGPTLARDAGSRDNRGLESRNDVLTFTTHELKESLEIAGVVKVELYYRSSAFQTDFFARLCDVDALGRSCNVTDGVVRVHIGKEESWGDQPKRVELIFSTVAYKFNRGTRIRLQLSSGAHPRYARNGGADDDLAESTETLPADQEVFHDSVNASALHLLVQHE